jgi:hypothetical protein
LGHHPGYFLPAFSSDDSLNPVKFREAKSMFCFRRTVIYLAALLSILGAASFAADEAIKGYLVDVACSDRRARKPASLPAHSKMCMQMPTCNNSGYGVLTEDKRFIQFDEEGNQKASKLLAETSKENDFRIAVTGSMEGDRLKVSKIELQ